MLARTFAAALAARGGEPAAALEQFDQILDRWDRLGNELAELWVLHFLVVLLDRVGAARDAAVLSGALLTAQDRYPRFGRYEAPVASIVAHVRDRLGARAAEAALAEGAGLDYPSTVAHARRAIRSARRGAAVESEESPGRRRPGSGTIDTAGAMLRPRASRRRRHA
jgi:hypothetical protein